MLVHIEIVENLFVIVVDWKKMPFAPKHFSSSLFSMSSCPFLNSRQWNNAVRKYWFTAAIVSHDGPWHTAASARRLKKNRCCLGAALKLPKGWPSLHGNIQTNKQTNRQRGWLCLPPAFRPLFLPVALRRHIPPHSPKEEKPADRLLACNPNAPPQPLHTHTPIIIPSIHRYSAPFYWAAAQQGTLKVTDIAMTRLSLEIIFWVLSFLLCPRPLKQYWINTYCYIL